MIRTNKQKQQYLSQLKNTPPLVIKNDYIKYQNDPVGFCTEILGDNLTGQQKEIANAVLKHKRITVKSANSVGKTYMAASLALWFYRCFPDSIVLTTAPPPLSNLTTILWGEIDKKLIAMQDVYNDSTQSHLMIKNKKNKKWHITGRAVPSTGTAASRETKFSGVHAPYMLFIIDEGDAIPDEVYKGIESCMSGGFAILIALFNPRSRSGPVYRMGRDGAKVINLDAFNHPNVITGNDVISGAISRKDTVERIAKWSRSLVDDEEVNELNPDYFQVPDFLDGEHFKNIKVDVTLVGGAWRKVTDPQLSYMTLARYPSQSSNQLISLEWIQSAIQRRKLWVAEYGDKPPKGAKLMGQDVADMGGDLNVVILRQGGWTSQFTTWDGMDIAQSADKGAKIAKANEVNRVYIDGTGLGAGIAPVMRRAWHTMNYQAAAKSVMVAGKSTSRVEQGNFKILRDQIAWKCREWLENDMSAMLPDDQDLIDELLAIEYVIEGHDIRTTQKKDLKKKLGRSPDKADALFLTFAPAPGFGVA